MCHIFREAVGNTEEEIPFQNEEAIIRTKSCGDMN